MNLYYVNSQASFKFVSAGLVFLLTLFSHKTLCAEHPLADGDQKKSHGAIEVAVRKSVQKSIPFIEKGGQNWISRKKCVTCHQVPFMVWSLNTADRLGFKVDQPGMKSASKFAQDWSNFTKFPKNDDATEDATMVRENDAISELLLSRPKNELDDQAPKWVETFRAHLVKSQQADGSWKPMGQLHKQKRPLRETTEVSTTWALLGIGTQDSGLDIQDKNVKRAIQWLGEKTAGKSTEWWATRLLLQRALGNEKSANELRKKLLNMQKKDGGWGWLSEEPSDAFGTGLAIYALQRDGLNAQHPSITSGIKFLVDAQNADGSWSVKGTKQGHRERTTKTASYWGTCWAVIGMMETLSEGSVQTSTAYK